MFHRKSKNTKYINLSVFSEKNQERERLWFGIILFKMQYKGWYFQSSTVSGVNTNMNMNWHKV